MKHVNSILIVLVLAAWTGSALGQANQDAKPESNQLVDVLKSDAPLKEKAAACRMLQRVATKEAIPVLAGLLADEKLSHMARYALEPLPDAGADGALRAALGKVKGRLLAGVIGSLGVRRDAQAVDALARLLTHEDEMVAQAAARALGSIGTPAGGNGLKRSLAATSEANRMAVCEGLLRCAERLAAGDSGKDAVAIYDLLRGTRDVPHQVRTAAVRGAILARGEAGLPLLVEYLHSKEYLLFAAACRTSMEARGEAVTQALVAAVGDVPAENQVLLLQTLGWRRDPSAVPAISSAAKEGPKSVRLAATIALGEVNHPSAAGPLEQLARDSDGDVSKAAKQALGSLIPSTQPAT